jgi:hypothetical protein
VREIVKRETIGSSICMGARWGWVVKHPDPPSTQSQCRLRSLDTLLGKMGSLVNFYSPSFAAMTATGMG